MNINVEIHDSTEYLYFHKQKYVMLAKNGVLQ